MNKENSSFYETKDKGWFDIFNFGEDVSIDFNRGNVENCSFINIAAAYAFDSNCLFNTCSFINNS